MKLFFILGRNPQLSRLEVLAYLEARGRKFKEVLFEGSFLIVEVPEDEKIDIQEFGGIVKLGKVNYEGDLKGLREYMQKNELVPADKFSYGIYGNLDNEPLKEQFKKEKKRAVPKFGSKGLRLQDGTKMPMPNTDFSILFHEYNNTILCGLVTQEYDSTEVEKRDMGKPVRREQLAISPRLAKILINLSGAKPGTLLLDPFCGIGGILMESLLKGIKCYGIDNDEEAVVGAKQNLEWLSKNFSIKVPYTLENEDSRKTPDLQFGAMATETPLGKVLRKRPSEEQANHIIQNFEALIIPIFDRLRRCKKSKARIAITFPVIGTRTVDSKKIAQRTNMKLVYEPIFESRPDQHISRQIAVFE